MSKRNVSYDPNAGQAASNPRAPTQVVGRVCQVWGVLLITVMCCVWATSVPMFKDLSQTPPGQQPVSWQQAFRSGQFGWRPVVQMLAIALPVALGFGFGGAGIGMVGQRPSAAWIALALATVQQALWLTLLAVNIAAGGAWGIAVAALFTLLSAGILALTMAAVSNLRRFPPPPDQTRLPEWVKEPKSYLNPDDDKP